MLLPQGTDTAHERRQMDSNDTFRSLLVGYQGKRIDIHFDGSTFDAKVFAVRADYVELEIEFATRSHGPEKKMIKMPLRSITWVGQPTRI
jgi:hypothetical protein